MNFKTKHIQGVVAKGLCTSCGTCVALCPHEAIAMVETPGGLLFAQIDPENCVECGLCLRGCGGAHLVPGLLPKGVDPFKGEVLAAYCGYATDSEIRKRGQSGGVVTALLAFMLESGRVDKALVNRMPEDGTLRPEPYWACNKEDLLTSQGSKYCPVALNRSIKHEVGQGGKKLAVVGLPCHLHSIRNVQQFNLHWKSEIKTTIGLFCDRTLAYGTIDYLVNKGHYQKKNVLTFRFRDKEHNGWPGVVLIRDKNGKEIRVASHERQSVKDYFTPPRCRLCFDKMNVLCDIALGDAWGIEEGSEGYSVLLARTTEGLSLIDDAVKAGCLKLEAISSEDVFAGQYVEVRRKQWTAFTKARQDMKDHVPDFGIDQKYEDQNINSVRNYVMAQILWQDKYFKGKTTSQIIQAVNIDKLLKKIKFKIKSFLKT